MRFIMPRDFRRTWPLVVISPFGTRRVASNRNRAATSQSCEVNHAVMLPHRKCPGDDPAAGPWSLSSRHRGVKIGHVAPILPQALPKFNLPQTGRQFNSNGAFMGRSRAKLEPPFDADC